VAVMVVAYSSWQLRRRDKTVVERINATLPTCTNGTFNAKVINNVRNVVTAPIVSVHERTYATLTSVQHNHNDSRSDTEDESPDDDDMPTGDDDATCPSAQQLADMAAADEVAVAAHKSGSHYLSCLHEL
jgi:hypothetical protein